MEATFKVAGDLEVLVANSPGGGVDVEIITGVWFGDGQDSREIKRLVLPKSGARAIASAIMGCAAEA